MSHQNHIETSFFYISIHVLWNSPIYRRLLNLLSTCRIAQYTHSCILMSVPECLEKQPDWISIFTCRSTFLFCVVISKSGFTLVLSVEIRFRNSFLVSLDLIWTDSDDCVTSTWFRCEYPSNLFDPVAVYLLSDWWLWNFDKWFRAILFHFYKFQFAGPILDSYPLMGSPTPMLLMLVAYWLFVAIAPRIMKNRKPINVNECMIAYNLYQVIFSSWLILVVSLKI